MERLISADSPVTVEHAGVKAKPSSALHDGCDDAVAGPTRTMDATRVWNR